MSGLICDSSVGLYYCGHEKLGFLFLEIFIKRYPGYIVKMLMFYLSYYFCYFYYVLCYGSVTLCFMLIGSLVAGTERSERATANPS